jgi:hypothetical protein
VTAPPRAALLALAGAWLAAAVFAFGFPLTADEAYYLDWSRRPALGYLDHPPGIAWWIGLGFGQARIPGLLLMPLAWWMLARAAHAWGVQNAWWVAVVVAWSPLGVGATALATPDQPLVFFWCALLWSVATGRVGWVGLCLGLCLWSKAAVLLAVPGLLWVLGARRAFVALTLAAALYAPHIAWSITHDGLPWTFQAAHRRPGFNLFELIGGQLLLATPLLAWEATRAWCRPRDATDRALIRLGLPVLLGFLAMSTFTRVEANWPALAWPATAILVVRRLERVRLRRATSLAAGMSVVLVVVALALRDRHALGPPRDTECLERSLPGEILVAARYQEAALMAATGLPMPYARGVGHRPSQYDRWFGPPTLGCEFLYLGSARELGDRCRGRVEPGPSGVCGRRPTTRCRCPEGPPR